MKADIKRRANAKNRTASLLTTLHTNENIRQKNESKLYYFAIGSLFIICIVIIAHFIQNSSVSLISFNANEVKRIKRKHPHIIIIMTDDVGFDDMNPYRKECTLPSIYNDLTKEGSIVLKTFYAQSVCTPSRAALLTGRYPIHSGMTYLIEDDVCNGLPLDEMLISDVLKSSGAYSTYQIGKWHLGHCKKEMIPVNRGFDYSYGYFQASNDFYLHTFPDAHTLKFDDNWYDFHEYNLFNESSKQTDPMIVFKQTFAKNSIELFNNKSIEIIKNYQNTDDSKSLFLYLAHGAIHGPLQTLRGKKECSNDQRIESFFDQMKGASGPFFDNVDYTKYSKQYDYMRRDSVKAQKLGLKYPHFYNLRPVICGMLSCVDDGIKQIIATLKHQNMLHDTILIFLNDNGGTDATRNFPLRSGKFSIYEGGTRTFGHLYAPGYFNSDNYQNNPYLSISSNGVKNEYKDLMHIVDIFPTVIDAANIAYMPGYPNIVNTQSYLKHIDNITKKGYKLDGVSHWDAFMGSVTNVNDNKPKRDHIIYGKSYTRHTSDKISYAVRNERYKLIKNYAGRSDFNVLLLPTQSKHLFRENELKQLNKIMDFTQNLQTFNVKSEANAYELQKLKKIESLEGDHDIYKIFDLQEDPSELNDLLTVPHSHNNHEIFSKLKNIMEKGYEYEIVSGHYGTIDTKECQRNGQLHWNKMKSGIGKLVDPWC